MGNVFVDVGLSVDGYLAGPNRGPGNPLGDGGASIHSWIFKTASFRQRLGMSGGEASTDDPRVEAVFARTGAYVMGRRMFDEGEASWPEVAPFRAPVFVVTHTARDAWPRKGGTTFHFVTDGIENAVDRAKAAAGDQDVRISGGAATIRQCLKAGFVDEITLHIAPVILGEGLRLFDTLEATDVKLEQRDVAYSAHVTHVDYRVVR